MTKAEKIADFIKENNPRRKDLVKFIVVTLNKKCTSTYFDNNKNEFRGYYSVIIQQWKWNQKIKKDSKTQRYSVTSYYDRDGSLYIMPIEVRLEIALRSNESLRKAYSITSRELRIERRKVTQLKEILG